MPLFPQNSQGFFLFAEADPQKAADWVLDLVANRIPARFGYKSDGDIQVLSPMHRGAVGVGQLNERLQQALTRVIYEQAGQLDPALPAILAAHVWVMNARVGTEKSMSIGQEHMLLLSSVAQPAFDYVALGHIHKGQILNEHPPVVYSGSLERVDFGDEGDEKGFYVVTIGSDKISAKRQVSYEFQPIDARRFFTLPIDIGPEDGDPTSTAVKAIELNRDKIIDAVTRIEIRLPSAVSGKLRDYEIRTAAREAYYLTIAKDIQRESRLRLGSGHLEGITPEDALKAWLESKYSPERAKLLFEYGLKLIREKAAKE